MQRLLKQSFIKIDCFKQWQTTQFPCLSMGKVFLFGPLILTNNWRFWTNILNISLDRNFPCIHDIVMGIRSVSPTTLIMIIRLEPRQSSVLTSTAQDYLTYLTEKAPGIYRCLQVIDLCKISNHQWWTVRWQYWLAVYNRGQITSLVTHHGKSDWRREFKCKQTFWKL